MWVTPSIEVSHLELLCEIYLRVVLNKWSDLNIPSMKKRLHIP